MWCKLELRIRYFTQLRFGYASMSEVNFINTVGTLGYITCLNTRSTVCEQERDIKIFAMEDDISDEELELMTLL